MALIRSLLSGVSGLQSHQRMMDIIGNNIANVNSVGFKGSRVTFSDTFNQFYRHGTQPNDSIGGTSAFQIGLGARTSAVTRNWGQGAFETTGVTTDLGLQGNGMFMLRRENEIFYSRAGNFEFDSVGNLVNPQNGAVVQGKMATTAGVIPPGNNYDDIVIDPNTKVPAVATKNVEWGGNLSSVAPVTASENVVHNGNLDSDAIAGDAAIESQSVIYDSGGNQYTFKTSIDPLGGNAYNLTYDLQDADGNSVLQGGPQGPLQMTFDPDTGLMNSFNGVEPAPITIDNNSLTAPLGIDFQYDPSQLKESTSTSTTNLNVDNGREPTIVSGTVSVYDSLGNTHPLTMTFTKTSDNNWDWKANVPDGHGSLTNAEGSMTFNPDGSINIIAPDPPTIGYTPTGGAEAQSIQLDFGDPNEFIGITQTSSSSVLSALTQDGSAAATLSNLSIDQTGNIIGVFSNGFSKNLARIMLASFPNRNGLLSQGDNLYSIGANTGEPYIGDPGEALQTFVHSGNLEQSNVDLAEEFTKMIVSQRGFQANSRVISVGDQLLQEITNLIR